MQLDDLDFLLLDAVSKYRLSLGLFSDPDCLGTSLNRVFPSYSFDELNFAFQSLFARGDAVVSIRKHDWQQVRKRFTPSLDEIEAGLRGAFDLVYELTPQGGARWEHLVRADWSLYCETMYTERYRWKTTVSREYAEFGLEVDRGSGRATGAVQWKEIRPWRPVYWKVLPQGYRARIEQTKEGWNFGGNLRTPRWAEDYTPRFHHKPVCLVPRKLRSAQPAVVGGPSTQPIMNFTEALLSVQDTRQRFAWACEHVPAVETEELLESLNIRSAEVSFAGTRELVRRRVGGAVPALASLAFRAHYSPAVWALGEIGGADALRALDVFLGFGGPITGGNGAWYGSLLQAIARFGDQALPILDRRLTSENRETRHTAITVLGLIGSAASRSLLERELERSRADGASEIERHLGVQIDWRTPEKLAENRLLRAKFVAIGSYDAPTLQDPIQALVDTLRHDDCARRREAIDLLVEFEARDRLAEISLLANDLEWQVRASVAYALRQLGGCEQTLAMLAEDSHLVVRWLAKNSIIPYED